MHNKFLKNGLRYFTSGSVDDPVTAVNFYWNAPWRLLSMIAPMRGSMPGPVGPAALRIHTIETVAGFSLVFWGPP